MCTPKKARLLTFFPVLLLTVNIWAFDFSGLNLSNDDRLLYRAEFEGQNAVFISHLESMSFQQITTFPEKMYLVDNGMTIITLNRFGAQKIPMSGGLPAVLEGYPSFSNGNIPLKGLIQDIAASPDGRFYLHIEPVSFGFGNLVLVDIAAGSRKIISEKIEIPGQDFPVKWSPNSRLFVYSKGGRLFFCPILDDMSVSIDERFRTIGSGSISSVSWGQNGNFYYITGSTFYRVRNTELFTRTIYGDFLSIGDVLGVFPFDFDSSFDSYWVSPDSSAIIINKGQKNLFFFPLSETNSYSSRAASLYPHILIPQEAQNFNVFWSQTGTVTITYSFRNQTTVLRIEINEPEIKTLTSPISPNGALSPDGKRAVFWGENGLELWDYTNWQLIQRISRDPVYSCVFINDRQLLAGSSTFIEEINISSAAYTRRRIGISCADEFGFEESSRDSARLLARVGSEWFVSDGGAWTLTANARLRQISLSSQRFRVFLEPQRSGYFNNIIMIRNAVSVGTVPLTSGHTANSIFTQAPQTEIALCFDLYDNDTGLLQVLSALSRHNIRATFFLNGEFIRRSPRSAFLIAEAGHEAASMFYAPVDLSDIRYLITREFITQGLARNEDEFYSATGRELSVLWHPPYYRSSQLINSAASAAGYITANRSIDPGDWVSKEDMLRLNLRQNAPAEMIDIILNQLKLQSGTGAVIPIRLGLLGGGRDDYLFRNIDVLLDALIRCGYKIVPVSAIIK